MGFEEFIAELRSTSRAVTAQQDGCHVIVRFPASGYPGYEALPSVREMVKRHGLKIDQMIPDNPQPHMDGEFALWPEVWMYVAQG